MAKETLQATEDTYYSIAEEVEKAQKLAKDASDLYTSSSTKAGKASKFVHEKKDTVKKYAVEGIEKA